MTLVKESVPAARKTRAAAPTARGRRGRRGRQENLAGYLFMSPWIAGFLLLTAGPMVASLYFAFTDYNLFNTPKWVGFDNFTGGVGGTAVGICAPAAPTSSASPRP